MEAYATGIGLAYLEATTQEKACIKAGPEFKELSRHLLIICKALYSLYASGKEFGDLLASCLKDLRFKPSYAELEIFMKENKDTALYECIATYVDDLCLILKEPEKFLRTLQLKPQNFKLKGSGPISFHLGCRFERDKVTGILAMTSQKYIKKVNLTYKTSYMANSLLRHHNLHYWKMTTLN